MPNLTYSLVVLVSLLALLVASCNVSDDTTTPNSEEVECERDADCDEGICQNGECIEVAAQGDFLDDCVEDSDCLSALCVEMNQENKCSETCFNDTDCAPDLGWTCQFSDSRDAEICLPAPPSSAPGSGFVFCSGATTSEGDGYRLEHCLTPSDMGSSTLSGENIRLQSGAFELITE